MAQLTIYLVNSTNGEPLTTIQPQTMNGPGGTQRSTDLFLFGNDFETWGEMLNENIVHLAENFAVGSKFEVEATKSEDPQTSEEEFPLREQPQDEDNLNITGAGITNPVIGQTWFNTTNKILYVYGGDKWHLSSIFVDHDPPEYPSEGALWFDTSSLRLKVQSSGIFDQKWRDYIIRQGDSMEGKLFLEADPEDNMEAATKQYVDSLLGNLGDNVEGNFLPLSGGTLSGSLTVQDSLTVEDSLSVTGQSNLQDNVDVGGQLNVSGTASLDNSLTVTGDTTLQNSLTVNANTSFNGDVTLNSNPSSNMEAATKQYVDAVGGDASTAVTSLNDLNDVDASPSAGDLLIYTGSNWKEIDPTGYLTPVGTIVPWSGPDTESAIPEGYLGCAGQEVSRTTFGNLNDLYSSAGYPYGAGDGSTTFNVPDLRGQFVRGIDRGRGLDPEGQGRDVGSEQEDAFQRHQHSYSYWTGQGSSSPSAGGSDFQDRRTQDYLGDQGGTPRVSSETRPTNIALVFLVKY